MLIALSDLGRAGQPGYVIRKGEAITVDNARNLPQGGYFVTSVASGESIHIGESELLEYVDAPADDSVNLDCTDIADLQVYLADESKHPLLRDYAACKARAMQCRESGRIADALKWEQAADHDYKRLPEHLKW